MAKSAKEIVTKFIQFTNDHKDVKGAVNLMDENIKFIGPAMQCNNRKEYEDLLHNFLPRHTGWKHHQTLEHGNEICFIEDIYLVGLNGEKITLELAEWFKVENEKIVYHKVFYDPTEFNKAFNLNLIIKS